MGWEKTLFLHTGWANKYDGTEISEGGHEYLETAVGVEAANFKSVDGWCYGYAPVSRTSKGRNSIPIPKGDRTLGIDKLGASSDQGEIQGVTVLDGKAAQQWACDYWHLQERHSIPVHGA